MRPALSYKTILAPLDGSTLAHQALPHARALAKQAGARIILLRVSTYSTYDFLFINPMLAATLRQTIEQSHDEERRYLREMAASLSADGLKVRADLREGDVAEAILNASQTCHADLLVMSTHGHGGLTRWLMGSVADKIVRHAAIPVLLIRANPVVVDTTS
jgi:nucleotide-binding universal stress UspA family protein